jgi:hypothetical protein
MLDTCVAITTKRLVLDNYHILADEGPQGCSRQANHSRCFVTLTIHSAKLLMV